MYITMILMFLNLKHKIVVVLLISQVIICKTSKFKKCELSPKATIINAANIDNRKEEKRIMMRGISEKGCRMRNN